MYGLKDFVSPVAGKYRITSGEGSRVSKKTTNGKKMSKFHYGTDWAGEKPGSTPDIRNITTGKVVYTGNINGYGNVVIVENPDGYKVQYSHLNSVAVKPGDSVPAGGKIGVMGATGNVTGTHLDLIVTKDGVTLNRDGSVLADHIPNTLRKIGSLPKNKVDPSMNLASNTAPAAPAAPVSVGNVEQSENNSTEIPTAVLSNGSGIVIPDTSTQNKIFSAVADMHLGSDLEKLYAEAGRAIADARDSALSKPMIESQDPLITELTTLFNSVDV